MPVDMAVTADGKTLFVAALGSSKIGVFDAAQPADRRFGALFDVGEARSGYGGGRAELVPPAPGPLRARWGPGGRSYTGPRSWLSRRRRRRRRAATSVAPSTRSPRRG